MSWSSGPRYLRCLQVLQGEVPQLGGRVQQQELETSRGDVRRLSGFTAGENESKKTSRSGSSVLQIQRHSGTDEPPLGAQVLPHPILQTTFQDSVHRTQGGSALPFHEARLNQQLRQVLADGSGGGAHHEVQDDLPALCGVAVQAADVARVPIRTQRASFVGPCSAPEGHRATAGSSPDMFLLKGGSSMKPDEFNPKTVSKCAQILADVAGDGMSWLNW